MDRKTTHKGTALVIAATFFSVACGVPSFASVQAQEKSKDQQETSEKADKQSRRFNSSHFLESLDILITEQASKRHRDKKNDLGDLKLSLDDKKSLPDISTGGFRRSIEEIQDSEIKEGSFLYLRDTRKETDLENDRLISRPDFSSLLSPKGSVRSVLTDNFASAGGKVGLSIGGRYRKDGQYDPGFQIALESAYRLIGDTVDNLGYNGLQEQLADREYNLGVSVGYSGFNLDASLTREWDPFSEESLGYEFGFSYQTSSWSARLAWNAYKSGTDLTGIENEERDYISFELGANLKLSERFGLSGGFRYYDYGARHVVSTGLGEQSQMIFLGGRMKF